MSLGVKAIEALTLLAKANTAAELMTALSEARNALGDEATACEPLLVSLAERASQVYRLERMAGSDSLTGAANRRGFQDALDRELARHHRTGEGMAIVLLDLDGLKQINDTYGHAAGDDAIVRVAEACRSVLRSSDLVARLGGDEFAILLPQVDRAGAEVVAERVREAVQASIVAGERLSVSVGLAVARGGVDSAPDLLAEADHVLYNDKRARKQRYSQVVAA